MAISTEPVMPEGKPAEATNGHSAGFATEAKVLTDAIRMAVGEILNLIGLETRLAIRSLLVVMIALLGICVLLATAWVGSMVVLTLLLMQFGLPPIVAVATLVSLNLLMLPIIRGLIRRRMVSVRYPVTRATLTSALSQLRGRALP